MAIAIPAYQAKIGPWNNKTAPYLNTVNLNKLEGGIVSGQMATCVQADLTVANAQANAGLTVLATDSGCIAFSDGNQWWPLGVGGGVLLAAPPANPLDGQVFDLSPDAANNPGVTWRMKYHAADASGYQWYCVGGSPISVETNASWKPPGSSAWAESNPTTRLVVPLPGDYSISFGSQLVNNGTSQAEAIQIALQLGQNAGTPSGGNENVVFNHGASSASLAVSDERTLKRTLTRANGLQLSLWGAQVNAADTSSYRFIDAVPIRVSA